MCVAQEQEVEGRDVVKTGVDHDEVDAPNERHERAAQRRLAIHRVPPRRSRQLGDREFTSSPAGYRALADWLGQYGTFTMVGVEGTGTYGAALARYLHTIGLTVVEVDRPDRKSRRAHGKSDPLDAYAAAKAVLSGSAAGVPKLRDGRVEAIRGAPRGSLQRGQSP